MPPAVREIVLDWKARWKKAFISVRDVSEFTPGEDAKVTIINLVTGQRQTERVAGEFAGFTKLNPCDPIPLFEGTVAVASGFFCGHPWLTVYQGTRQRIIGKEIGDILANEKVTAFGGTLTICGPKGV